MAQDYKTKETIAVDTVLNKNENQINKWEIAKKSKELRDKKKRIQELYQFKKEMMVKMKDFLSDQVFEILRNKVEVVYSSLNEVNL